MKHAELREALTMHLEETRVQVERLEQVFESLGLKPKGKYCAGMAGILEEGSDLLEEDGDDAVLDAAFSRAANASSTTKSLRTGPSWHGRSCSDTMKR